MMGRNAEAIKESFQSVTGHDKTKIFLAFGCQNQQPLPAGSRQMQRVSSGERLQVWFVSEEIVRSSCDSSTLRMQNLLETHVSVLPPNPVFAAGRASVQDAPQ